MDNYWAEVADHIEAIEQLYEDDKFPNRELAAVVASKVKSRTKEFEITHFLCFEHTSCLCISNPLRGKSWISKAHTLNMLAFG
jgi:hypothetical protein